MKYCVAMTKIFIDFQVIILMNSHQMENLEVVKGYLMDKHRLIPIKTHITVLQTSGNDEMGVGMMIVEEVKLETDILFQGQISQPKFQHNTFSP